MPVAKVSEGTVREILKLHRANTDPAEIAAELSLKKVQVTSIIAHEEMKNVAGSAAVRSEEPATLEPVIADDSRSKYAVPELNMDMPQPEALIIVAEPEIREEVTDGVLVGEDCEFSEDFLYWTPQNAAQVQNPHLMIVGESGSGKTYTVQCLAAELAQRNIPSVIFDYGQGFELDTLDETFRTGTQPKEYLLGEEGVSLNPLRIFSGDAHGPKSVATRLSDVFDAVYGLGAIQRKVLIDAILLTFQRAGISADDRTTWDKPTPSVNVLQEVLDELSADKEYPNSKNAVGLAARLTTFFMLSSFRNDDAWSWERLIGDPDHRVHILQFRGLEGKTQRVLVEVLLWHFFFYLKSQGQQPLRVYCVLDEAHHLSFRDGGPIDQLLREARKFGVGLMFASQQPEDFSPAAFSNTASKLVFQTADPTMKVSRFLAAKCTNYDSAEQIHETIAVLLRGEALFITRNRGHVVKIVDLRKRATLWGQK